MVAAVKELVNRTRWGISDIPWLLLIGYLTIVFEVRTCHGYVVVGSEKPCMQVTIN